MLLCGSLLCFELCFVAGKFFFLSFHFAVKAHGVFCKLSNVLLYAESFLAGNFTFLEGAHQIFQLAAAVNKEVVEFLLLAFFEIRLHAAEFQFTGLKAICFFLCLGSQALRLFLYFVELYVFAV